jgi:hypothetical protein
LEKKRNQSNLNSLKETPKKASSTIHHLLLRHKLPSDFPLEQQIKEFNMFRNKARLARLDLDGKLEAFAKEKKWTDDDRKNFRIMSAIKDGWRETFDRTAKKHLMDLIAQKGQEGEWVYKYQCCKCESIDQRGITRMLSEYQYNQLPEDEARKALLETEINSSQSTTDGWVKCPNCREYAQFKKVRARTQSWEMYKHLRKGEKVQESTSNGIPPNAIDDWNNNIASRYKEITANMFQKGIDETVRELAQLWRDAKPYMERIYKPSGDRLCARVDCLRFLPQGSRSSRKYCSEQCKATEKSRNARRR